MEALFSVDGLTALDGQQFSAPSALLREMVFNREICSPSHTLLTPHNSGNSCYSPSSTTEGLAGGRMQTEFFLARDIQANPLPTIALQTPGFEIYGKSMPSTEMGGDLIGVVESGGSVLAYVLDISGRGLAAGQLMGCSRALRTSLQ